MKRFNVVALLLVVVLLSGCAITHDYKAAAGIKDAGMIQIIDNPGTREGFLDTMVAWLDKNGYKHTILPQNTSKDHPGWVLTYDGKWSWDLTIYLSKATISAYENGVKVGNATYSVAGNNMSFNLKKWKKADIIVEEMMSNLFSGK